MAKAIARDRISAKYPTLHEGVTIEEVDCDVLENKPLKYTYEKEPTWVKGRLIYITDATKDGGSLTYESILHVLLTERGTFVAAVAHDHKITPQEIGANFNWRVSCPFGDPSYVGKKTLTEVLDHLALLTPAARQERLDEYHRIKQMRVARLEAEENERVAERVKVYRTNETWLREQGLTQDQTVAVLERFGVTL